MRASRVGKCRCIVPTPTPAAAAMSRTGTSTPEATKAAAAAASRVSSLRRASDRFPRGGVADPLALSATDQAPPPHPLVNRNAVPYGRFSEHRSACRILDHPWIETWRGELIHVADIPGAFRDHDRPVPGRVRRRPAGLARGRHDPGDRARVALRPPDADLRGPGRADA